MIEKILNDHMGEPTPDDKSCFYVTNPKSTLPCVQHHLYAYNHMVTCTFIVSLKE
uniref:Uncharacterized protein n=1 Tax=Candidatus Kentrum sp. MB TaxID=2138164 RepID=A0A450XXF0_9GAMM|nr:MAG: hypothetical protein BECKMB1821I_GA0114274_105715 [Candidatus Kentron sp. MB]VFK76531.1 MAG: hypothetical protein BECKMB1821H_GA0114242_106114 [Candidatus Kentron sp. MB]